MLDEVRSLLVLQDRDRRLMALRKELAGLPQEEARTRAKLAGDEARTKQAHDELKTAELAVKKIEMDVETRRNTIKRLQVQQFETKKNDEYNALGHEIIRYQKDVDDLETKELEAMEVVDSFKEKYELANAALKKSKSFVEEDLLALQKRHEVSQGKLSELEEERETLMAPVSEDLLPMYEKLMRSKDGLAIASLRAGKCTGCHMKVISSTVIAVQQEKNVTQCENCGRILAVDE